MGDVRFQKQWKTPKKRARGGKLAAQPEVRNCRRRISVFLELFGVTRGVLSIASRLLQCVRFHAFLHPETPLFEKSADRRTNFYALVGRRFENDVILG